MERMFTVNLLCNGTAGGCQPLGFTLFLQWGGEALHSGLQVPPWRRIDGHGSFYES
jgi:hypothetical protein